MPFTVLDTPAQAVDDWPVLELRGAGHFRQGKGSNFSDSVIAIQKLTLTR
jgi:hypothetical protein